MSIYALLRGKVAHAKSNFGQSVFFVALTIWGLVPALVMIVLLFYPEKFINLANIWGATALSWSTASLFLFVFALLGGYQHGKISRTIQGIVGLTCTLVLGLPAIILSTLPLFGSPQDFLQSLNPEGTEVALLDPSAATASEPKDEKVLFIVGIDASRSFINDNDRGERLSMVYEVLDSMFYNGSDNSFAKALHPHDLIMYYAFAGKNRLIQDNSENGEGQEIKRIRPSRDLPALLATLIAKKDSDQADNARLKRNTTDLIGFLDKTVCGEIRDRESKFTRVKILLFSDLIHSVAGYDESPGFDFVKDRANKLSEIEECVRGAKIPVSITAFHAKSTGGAREELAGDEMYIGNFMSSNLSDQWQEIEIDKYSRASLEERAVRCESLYAKIVPSDSPLYLKFHPQPNWEALESRLRLPRSKDTDTIFLGLQATGGGTTPLKIRFGKGHPGDFVLGIGEKERAYTSLERLSSEQNPLKLFVENYPEALRGAHSELLVAVPRRSVLYRIPIVILNVMPAKTMLVVKGVFAILHLFPLALAIAIVSESLKRSRGVKRKRVATPRPATG